MIDEVKDHTLTECVRIAKALSDANRLRAVLALRNGELCLCQLIEYLQIAPSTASSHMAILAQAGLVQCRRRGRWRYYRLTDYKASTPAGQAIAWVLESHPVASRTDDRRLRAIRNADLKQLCNCYAARTCRTSAHSRTAAAKSIRTVSK